MTGAKVPDNCTAIVPKENCEVISQKQIIVPKDIKLNQHIRFIGEDIKKEEILLKEKEEINFSKINSFGKPGNFTYKSL